MAKKLKNPDLVYWLKQQAEYAAEGKPECNETILLNLIRELEGTHPLFTGILRERITNIVQQTLAGIARNPKAYDNPFINHKTYKEWALLTQKLLK